MFFIFIKLLIFIATTFQVVLSAQRNCFLPAFPELKNLIFKEHPVNHTIELGSIVENFVTVHVECKNGLSLTGSSSLLCNNGEWSNDFPTCIEFCDGTLLKSLSIRAVCVKNWQHFRCPDNIKPGTSIHVHCAFGYSHRTNTQHLTCLPNGKFDKIPNRCEMQCGRVASDLSSLSKNGIEVTASNAPWHVTIYEYNRVSYHYVCHGSIISPSIVITAARCVWDEANKLLKKPDIYQIIAGRNTKNYSSEQSEYSQIVHVKEIQIPSEYQGRDNGQLGDIAFVKLERPLRYSETIAPICLAKDLRNTASKYMQRNRLGVINTFGNNNQLERVNMKTVANHECIGQLVNALVPEDKFCTYTSDDALVCRGDSGGGFAIGQTDSDTGDITYSLWGVISNVPYTKNECTGTGDQAYVAITNIFHTSETFKKILTIARRDDEELF